MLNTYDNRKKVGSAPNKEAPEKASSLDALRAGAAPSQEQLGHRVGLPEAMREKMENAFGADLSAVKLYESEAVADAGAGAVTKGSNIAFAPGMLDFTSFGGQALLGHEISHVVSQARGEVTGSGFLNDRSLEARADREGAMAAAGQQISVPTEAMSSVTAARASGPMQAGGKDDRRRRQANEYREKEIQAYDSYVQAKGKDPKEEARLKAEYEKNRDLKVGRLRKLKMSDEDIESDNRGTTSPMAQLRRAHDRHLSSRIYKDDAGSEAEARKQREKQSTAYLGNLQSIMDNLSDDELKADTLFQKSIVDSYGGAYRRLYTKGGYASINGDPTDYSQQVSGPFLPGNGPDLLGSMYGRLMGSNNIRAALDKDNDDASISELGALAESSGVSGLMSRQYQKTDPDRHGPSSSVDLGSNRDAMRQLLSKTVAPMMSDSDKASRRVSAIDSTLSRPLPEPVKEEEPQRSILDTMSEEEYDEHLGMMHRAELNAAIRKAIRDQEKDPVAQVKKAVTGAVESAKESVEDAVYDVKDKIAEHSEGRKKKKQSREEKKRSEKERKRRTDPPTKKELNLFRSVYGPGADPSGEQLYRLRNEIMMAEAFNRPVNVRGACGDLEPLTASDAATSTSSVDDLLPTVPVQPEPKKKKHRKKHSHKSKSE